MGLEGARVDRPLLKLYGCLAALLALLLCTFPQGAPRSYKIAEAAETRFKLAVYKGGGKGNILPGRGNVVIIMDDGWESQYSQGYTVLREYGFPACIAVIPGLVGEYQYMNYRQLAELYVEGWDLLNHTYNHYNLLQLPPEQQRSQLVRARNWLKNRGFERGSQVVVYPQGDGSAGLNDLLAEEGFIAARSLDGLWNAEGNCLQSDVEICNLISDITFAEVREAVDSAIVEKKTVILVLHKIEPVTVSTQMQLPPELFREVIDYLGQKADNLNVVTLTELFASQNFSPKACRSRLSSAGLLRVYWQVYR